MAHKQIKQKKEEGGGNNEDTISRGLTDEYNTSGEAHDRYNNLVESDKEEEKQTTTSKPAKSKEVKPTQ